MKKDVLNGEHRWRMKEWVKPILEEHGEKCLPYLSLNPNGVCEMEILLKGFEKIGIKEYRHFKYYDKQHIFSNLSMNPSAIYLLEKNMEWISWSSLNLNESSWAIDMLKQNRDKIEWYELSKNSHAIDMIYEYFDDFKSKYHHLKYYLGFKCEIKPESIVSNTKGMDIVEHYIQLYLKDVQDAIEDEPFFFNGDEDEPENHLWTNPSAIPLIEKYYVRNDWFINWEKLSSNPNAKEILERNMDQIDWDELSLNTGLWAIELLEQNQDKINWSHLCENPSAIHLIESNLDKSDLFSLNLFKNPAIFELDYDFLRRRMDMIREELIEKAWHPSRFEQWCI